MSRSTISTFKLFQMFPDERSARMYLENRLWPGVVKCPTCAGHDRITASADGAEENEMAQETLGKYGHHPDTLIDAQVELDRLTGLLAEAHGGMLRALDFRTASPEGLSIKADVRDALRRTGFVGDMGLRTTV